MMKQGELDRSPVSFMIESSTRSASVLPGKLYPLILFPLGGCSAY